MPDEIHDAVGPRLLHALREVASIADSIENQISGVDIDSRRSELSWNVSQYERFRCERARPFLDLLARVGDRPVARAVDLGCGTRELTTLLIERWPAAHVVGVDSSEAMLAAARPRAIARRLDFIAGDVSTWHADTRPELIFSNAVLQWVPDHDALLPRLAGSLAPGGVLAVEMPANFDAPSHRILDEVLGNRGLEHLRRKVPVRPLGWYAETLLALGLDVDAWETTYVHVLRGEDPVLEWVKGTALTPILDRLDGDARAAFLADYGARLHVAYPPTPSGVTLLPFRRLFFVATRLG